MKMKKHIVNWIIFSAIVIVAIVVDQVTKVCFEGWDRALLGNFLWISSVHNEGAAFGMMAGARWWFIGFAIPVMGAIAYIVFAKKISQSKLFVVSLALVFGGIVGNLVDRIAFGFVRDFVDFRFSGFAIFNMADSFLCVGAALLVLWLLIVSFSGNEEQKNMDNKKGKTLSEDIKDGKTEG